ncbi:GFA family protein [Streptomyces sp. NPDC001407]|uniref:GFA family protein n=1 Tax=Streptomyces sp. NPDC001407 TaxID=3364573 RepID=UPI00368CA4F5
MSTASHQPGSGSPTKPVAAPSTPGRTAEGPAPVTAALEPKKRTGSCVCGHTKYEVTGDPDDPHLCACRHETRISGGPAVLWVGFPKESLRWVGPGGEPTWYASWPTLCRGFCPRCGSQLVSVAEGSDMIMVTAFSLDDRTGTDPVGFSFRDEAVPWMTIRLASDSSQPPVAAP